MTSAPCDKYCSHSTHPFMFKLNEEELDMLARRRGSLDRLRSELHEFFLQHPDNDYFLRFNKLSPKDAYYFMNDDIDEDEDMTLDTIRRDLEYLHIRAEMSVCQKVDHCINVITHSDRVYCEALFLDDGDELIFLLLDYKNINHRSETRCFIKDGKLIAMSQYYVDLYDAYDHGNVRASIMDYFMIPRSVLLDYVADIHIVGNIIEIIEFNPFNHATDPCLFTWEELDRLSSTDPVEFRTKL
jgi:hypothetical protein